MRLVKSKKFWIGLITVLVLSVIILGAWVSQEVTSAFDGRKWRLPSLVYGRPLELFVGKQLPVSKTS